MESTSIYTYIYIYTTKLVNVLVAYISGLDPTCHLTNADHMHIKKFGDRAAGVIPRDLPSAPNL
jgi:hypothetical protein